MSNFDQLKNSMHPSGTTPVFDIDQRTGFMAPRPPIPRLPETCEIWERALDTAIERKIQLGDKIGLTLAEAAASLGWRNDVRQMPILPVAGPSDSPILLRRAHVVLAYTMHFYIQSMPPDEAVIIPKSIGIPLLQISKKLDIPPILTFADTVLYNWDFKLDVKQEEDTIPTPNTIRTQTMFTNTTDEEEFYLCSARIELRGVEVLELMRMTMDETFIGDALAARRITGYLQKIADVIQELKSLLLDVKRLCDPDIYYNQVRPWFRGEDSSQQCRKWTFEGLEEHPELGAPTELSGPSAGQSSMVHVLDIFLGVDHQPTSPGKPPFMDRMKIYMPRNHRLFLNHLKANPRPLRSFVTDSKDAGLLSAYNHAVTSLKQFRDSHLIIATLYIVGPARRAAKLALEIQAASSKSSSEPAGQSTLKGTGGTDLVKFLKDTRARTTETLIQ